MGDRGNIAVQQDDGSLIYLYTHWSGSEIESDLRTALSKRWRWGDPAYLTRIIFDVMTEGSHGSETGFGISTSIPDNEHDILVVDTLGQKVHSTDTGKSWSFEDFIAKRL